MPLKNRSRVRQIVYFLLVFGCLVVVADIITATF